LVFVLFWSMVRKALFHDFNNISCEISWNFLMYGKLKYDLWKHESQKFNKTLLSNLHGRLSYTFMWVSNVWLLNPGRWFILSETPKVRSKYCFFMIIKPNSRIFQKRSPVNWSHNHCYTLKTQGGHTFWKIIPSVL
jgi:hypothetical protein